MLRNIVAGVLIASLPVILLLTDRDWVLSDQNRAVAHVADIPPEATGQVIDMLAYGLGYNGVHVPRKPTKASQIYQLLVLAGRAPPARITYNADRPRYGYSVREWTFLGMPFGWYSEYGFVVYRQNRWELVMAPLIPEADAQLHKEVGRDLRKGFVFPFWSHGWGWLYLAGVALWGWLYHRSVVKRREADGII